tara:strand:+ start:19 stop:741 length:723 start_codon:yes stop_codon:yes gene_type:complete
MEDQLLKHFDDTGRKEIKETREKYLQEKEELDKSYKGRMAIKKELIRIKETGPQKCLDIMMKLTMKVDDIKNKLDECDFEEKDDIMNSIDELENLIANPDNDNNIFNSVTELMSVCDESEITKKINISNSERKMKKISEAQMISFCNDPLNTKYTMCPKCMRCMSSRHYKYNHQRTEICEKITNTKMATLNSGKMYSVQQGKDYVKLTARTTKDFNEISDNINWGLVNKIKLEDKEKEEK